MKNRYFQPKLALSQKRYDTTVTMADEEETISEFSNGAIFNDLDYCTLTTATIYRESHMVYRTAPISITLNDPKHRFRAVDAVI